MHCPACGKELERSDVCLYSFHCSGCKIDFFEEDGELLSLHEVEQRGLKTHIAFHAQMHAITHAMLERGRRQLFLSLPSTGIIGMVPSEQ